MVLAWVDDGRTTQQMADDLDVEPEAVASMIQLARAKLERLAGDGEVPPPTA
jgi:hypothetical protein